MQLIKQWSKKQRKEKSLILSWPPHTHALIPVKREKPGLKFTFVTKRQIDGICQKQSCKFKTCNTFQKVMQIAIAQKLGIGSFQSRVPYKTSEEFAKPTWHCFYDLTTEQKGLLLSWIHKAHRVNSPFRFFPSNQVLAGSPLARVESPRTRRGGGGRGERRCKLWGSGRVRLFLGWTSGTRVNNGTCWVPRAHGAGGEWERANLNCCLFSTHFVDNLHHTQGVSQSLLQKWVLTLAHLH